MSDILKSMIACLLTVAAPISNVHSSEPYCGVYSLYAASDALGVKTDFESLLSNKYVIDSSGSSIDSLALAATDLGLQSSKLSGLGRFDLHSAQTPIILHVRSDSTRPDFDHWVLYLGSANGLARILDPNAGEQKMPFEELLVLWDGAGLAVSNSTVELQVWHWSGFLARGICLCAFALVISQTVSRWNRNSSGQSGLRAKILGVICLFGLLVGMGLVMDHLIGGRLLANPYPSRVMANLYSPVSFPELDRSQLESKLTKNLSVNQIVLVDARMAKDFMHDPLPNAISVPIDGSPLDELRITQNFDTKCQLVVYCQSSGCTYSDVVAKRLSARGFEDISIFRDGVMGWKKKKE